MKVLIMMLRCCFHWTTCKHCITTCFNITHNKQDTSIVALITLLWIIHPVHLQRFNICLNATIQSSSHYWPQFPIKFWKVVHQSFFKIEISLWIRVSEQQHVHKSGIVSILSSLLNSLPLPGWCIGHFMVGVRLISQCTQVRLRPPWPRLRVRN